MPDCARWVQVATDLGRALGEVGNYPGARQQYEHILNVSCKTYGSDHPMTIRPYAVTPASPLRIRSRQLARGANRLQLCGVMTWAMGDLRRAKEYIFQGYRLSKKHQPSAP